MFLLLSGQTDITDRLSFCSSHLCFPSTEKLPSVVCFSVFISGLFPPFLPKYLKCTFKVFIFYYYCRFQLLYIYYTILLLYILYVFFQSTSAVLISVLEMYASYCFFIFKQDFRNHVVQKKVCNS